MQIVEGRTLLASTVSSSGAFLTAPQHTVCSLSFDSERGHCITGDTDGLVRVWDVAQCVYASSIGEPMGRECRLGLHRLHHKSHCIRWVAAHGRRLLAGCAGHGDAPGRLVLVDMDDSSANSGQRNLGAAATAVDTACGFLGTGALDGSGNGIPEHMGWAGLDGSLIGYNLELEHATTHHRPLDVMTTIPITARIGEYVNAAIPSLGVAGNPALSAVVATNFGQVCTVDLGCWHRGVDPSDDTILRRWSLNPESELWYDNSIDLVSSLAIVPSTNLIIVSQAQSIDSTVDVGMLRVLDPRVESPVTKLQTKGKSKCIVNMFSPPDCSIPTVLACLGTGDVVAVDLRKLGRDFANTDWPVVIAANAGGGISNSSAQPGIVTGDGKTLMSARIDGVMVGVYGRPADVAGAIDTGDGEGTETRAERWARVKEERKAKKQREKERKANKALKKQNKDAGRRQTTGKQGGRSKGSR